MNDSRDVPIATSSQAAVDAYSRAVDESVLYVGDPLASTAAALEADPNLVLAHTFNAMYNLLGNTRLGLADALDCIEGRCGVGGAVGCHRHWVAEKWGEHKGQSSIRLLWYTPDDRCRLRG